LTKYVNLLICFSSELKNTRSLTYKTGGWCLSFSELCFIGIKLKW